MAISSVGVGSGLELEELLKNMISAERDPATKRMDLKETTINANVTAYNSLKDTLSAFQTSLANLKSASFVSKQTATVGNSALVQATTSNGAQSGSYNLEVFEMAKAQKLATTGNFANPSATVGSGGTLNFAVGSSSFNVTISATDSLTAIRDKVNNASGNTGVSASLLTVDAGNNDGSTVTRLVFTAKNTGAANAININATDDDGINNDLTGLSQLATANLDEITPAQDARIAIDGMTVLSASNTISTAISGVSIQLFKESSKLPDPESTTLLVGNDKAALTKEIETFVATYNELTTVFNTLTNYNASTEQGGLLSGDSTVNVIESQLRRIMSSVNSGASEDMNSLAFLGIKTNQNGTIALDSEKLADAMNTKFDKIDDLFTGDNGIMTKLDNQLKNILGAGGAISTRQEGFKSQIKDIDDQRDKLELRLEKMEARYRAQFSALDTLVAQLNQTSTFLEQQLGAISAMISGKK